MKASKPLASVVAAAAVVGAIGLAYAQTPGGSTGATSSGDTSSQTMQNQGTTGTSTDTTGSSTGTSGSTMGNSSSTTSSDTTGFQSERPAQADRN
ncbi:MAG: hypothetical protein JF626_02815 [Polaromonas sp.]|nr:hypothetical protein [Polaromonas sp.]